MGKKKPKMRLEPLGPRNTRAYATANDSGIDNSADMKG